MIYFIQPVDGGSIKIGKANSPPDRLRELQTGSPDRLKIIGMMQGDEATEYALHDLFARHRLDGEWFSPDDDLTEFIETVVNSRNPFLHYGQAVKRIAEYGSLSPNRMNARCECYVWTYTDDDGQIVNNYDHDDRCPIHGVHPEEEM